MTDKEAIKITLDNESKSIYELIQMAYENGRKDGTEEYRKLAQDICHEEYKDIERRTDVMIVVNLAYERLKEKKA